MGIPKGLAKGPDKGKSYGKGFFWAHAVRARGSDGHQNVLS